MFFRVLILVSLSGTALGKLFNLGMLQAKTKLHTDMLDELKISPKTIDGVLQLAPGKPSNNSTIAVNRQKLKVVDTFTYRGSMRCLRNSIQ